MCFIWIGKDNFFDKCYLKYIKKMCNGFYENKINLYIYNMNLKICF